MMMKTISDVNHNGVVDSGETDPYNADTDGDGYNDGEEVNAGSNPLNKLSYPATTSFQLKKGFNFIAIPAEVEYQKNLREWLPILGDSSEIEKVMIYDDDAGKFITLIPGDTSNALPSKAARDSLYMPNRIRTLPLLPCYAPPLISSQALTS
jgi:hypothetical protein